MALRWEMIAGSVEALPHFTMATCIWASTTCRGPTIKSTKSHSTPRGRRSRRRQLLGRGSRKSGHDWGDIAVDAANNVLLSFTMEFGLQRYNLSTGALINRPVSTRATWGFITSTSTGTLQAATEPDGHVYVVGMHDIGPRNVPSIRQIDPVTGQPTGSLIDLTTDGVTTLSGEPNDAALLPVATGKIAGTVYYDTDHDNVLGAAKPVGPTLGGAYRRCQQ